MKDRNVIHLGHLDVRNDHATDYQYDVIRDARYQEHRDHQVQLLLRDLLQLPPFGEQFPLAKLSRTLQHYLLEKFLYVVIQNLP